MSPLLNYTTAITVAKTSSEIMQRLANHGATAIMATYNGQGVITGLAFKVPTPTGNLSFRLPIDADAVLSVLARDGKVPPRYQNLDQARRIAWRIIKDWVAAQLALLETEMVRLEEIFLPYLLVDGNQTVFQRMMESHFELPERAGSPTGGPG